MRILKVGGRRPVMLATWSLSVSAALLIAAVGFGQATVGPAPVIASVQGTAYHRPDCKSGLEISPRNRVMFPSLAEAEAQGLKACRTCRPNAAIRGNGVLQQAATPPTMLLAQANTQARPKGKGRGATSKNAPAADTKKAPAGRFAKEVAPVLVANCARCHNDQQKRGGLDMGNFQKLLAGGESGPVIVAGKPEESELIKRVLGESQPKMPPGQTNLAEATIEKLSAWIRDGAVLDPGVDSGTPMAQVAVTPEMLRREQFAAQPPEEQTKRLKTIASERWKKADPAGPPEPIETPHFAVFSKIPAKRTETMTKALENALGVMVGLLSEPAKPLELPPEKYSVYVFAERAKFAEFVRAVMQQEVADGVFARANLQGEAPYLVVLDPLGGGEEPAPAKKGAGRSRKGAEAAPTGQERTLAGVAAEQLASGLVASRGQTPRWLVLGLGAWTATRYEPQGHYARRLRGEAAQLYQIGWMTKATEALGDQTDDAQLRAVGFSLIDWLSNGYAPTLGPFVRGMTGGAARLDEGIRSLYGVDREAFLRQWGGWVASTGGARGRR